MIELARTIAALRTEIDDLKRNALRLEVGEVTAVDTTTRTVTVEIAGSTAVAGVPVLGMLWPETGDIVVVLMAGASPLVLGEVAGNGPQLRVVAPAAGKTPLDVWGASGQTAALQRWITSSGSLLLWVASDGDINIAGGVDIDLDTGTGTKIGTSTTQKLAFYNSTPIVKPTVSGAKGSNAALGSLMTALANLGLVVDSTTA